MESISWTRKKALVWGATALLLTSVGIGIFAVKGHRHLGIPNQALEFHVKPPSPPRTPLPPQTVSISCTESTTDPTGGSHSKISGLVDEVHSPEGDFLVSVEATRDELPAHLEEPKVRFWIAENGEIVDAEIVHSSGSKELDKRILHQVATLKISPSHHRCRIEESVPVDIE